MDLKTSDTQSLPLVDAERVVVNKFQRAVIPLSIVIPCKDEVGYIGQLLDSLLEQTYDISSIPVIIADAGSTDGTIDLLEAYRNKTQLNILITDGGYPARARNRGATESNSTFILFLDADIQLMEVDFIEKVMARAAAEELDCIGTLVSSGDASNWKDKIIWNALTVFMYAYPILKPFSSGMCIFMRRSVFEKIGGFNESVMVGEDVDLTSQVERNRFGIVRRHVVTSNRRFKKMGYAKTMRIYTKVFFSKKFRHSDHSYYFNQ